MPPSVDLSPRTFARLQTHAVPLVDTIETVINRILDTFEQIGGSLNTEQTPSSQSGRQFNPFAAPDLTHAKILGVSFAGQELGRGQDTWNGLLNAAVRYARTTNSETENFHKLMVIKFVEGVKSDEGYRPFPEFGISVQGQDANGAWRAVAHIAKELNCNVFVKFAWREKKGAAFPGVTGSLKIDADPSKQVAL